MNLSISNIAWTAPMDAKVYRLMRQYGFSALEIAPTRVFPANPYDRLEEAEEWSKWLKTEQGFGISSMQSIWYGRKENIFGSVEERDALMDYSRKAVDFAQAIGCGNLVFGCPKNRCLPEGADPEKAVPFFRAIGDYAFEHGTVIGMEANPPIYGTNYINTTADALRLIRSVDSPGFLLNLDLGTMIYNGEEVGMLEGSEKYIHHVHISEPGLAMPQPRELQRQLISLLYRHNYQGYISVEMKKTDKLCEIESSMSLTEKLLVL